MKRTLASLVAAGIVAMSSYVGANPQDIALQNDVSQHQPRVVYHFEQMHDVGSLRQFSQIEERMRKHLEQMRSLPTNPFENQNHQNDDLEVKIRVPDMLAAVARNQEHLLNVAEKKYENGLRHMFVEGANERTAIYLNDKLFLRGLHFNDLKDMYTSHNRLDNLDTDEFFTAYVASSLHRELTDILTSEKDTDELLTVIADRYEKARNYLAPQEVPLDEHVVGRTIEVNRNKVVSELYRSIFNALRQGVDKTNLLTIVDESFAEETDPDKKRFVDTYVVASTPYSMIKLLDLGYTLHPAEDHLTHSTASSKHSRRHPDSRLWTHDYREHELVKKLESFFASNLEVNQVGVWFGRGHDLSTCADYYDLDLKQVK